MTEIILTNKKHGMPVLLLTILVYILAVAGTIYFAMAAMVAPMVVCIVILCLGWLTLPGLKVLGPQEALVLTLFGNYIGTLRSPLTTNWNLTPWETEKQRCFSSCRTPTAPSTS